MKDKELLSSILGQPGALKINKMVSILRHPIKVKRKEDGCCS